MSSPVTACVILAAGNGTRMRSAVPKVLHELAGRSMLAHVLATAGEAGISRPVVVVGPDMDDVAAEARRIAPEARVAVQHERCGTGDAVGCARSEVTSGAHDIVLVLYGDTPLLRAVTLKSLTATLGDGADLVVLGFQADDPTGYGRLICDSEGKLSAIREEMDASEEERRITLCNSGVMALRGVHLFELLGQLKNDNAKGEYYLTDTVDIARNSGLSVEIRECDAAEVMGVNTRLQLADAEAEMQRRLRTRAMEAGATLHSPDQVYFSHDTRLGRDVVVEPNVVFRPGVRVGDRVHIRANCHLEGATIADDAVVGPFARLRPGAKIGAGARVGNFVEVKQADIGAGAKVNHLTYIGDAVIGAAANIGAGTITCNYDGFNKHLTEIGEGAFIGSNSALVAPVKIGARAYIGSGSVITRDVSDGALAVSRGKQMEKPGWADRIKARRKAAKSNKGTS